MFELIIVVLSIYLIVSALNSKQEDKANNNSSRNNSNYDSKYTSTSTYTAKITSNTNTTSTKSYNNNRTYDVKKRHLNFITWNREITSGIKSGWIGNYSPYLLEYVFNNDSRFEGDWRYYTSAYVCPCCNEHPLYKMRVRGTTSAPPQNSTKFVDRQSVELFNLFTCPKCRIFFASVTLPEDNHDPLHTSMPLDKYAMESMQYSSYIYPDILLKTLEYYNDPS